MRFWNRTNGAALWVPRIEKAKDRHLTAELTHRPNMLNDRRYSLDKIPEQHREWVKLFVQGGSVVVMDNRLDAHFRDLPGWFGDRHPNLAGYHVIGDETAKFLAKQIRERPKTTK